MGSSTPLSILRKIMLEFSSRTGLSPAKEIPRRYLWTDAFAVCNFLELYRQTGDEEFRDLALRLVGQVHGTLGRHRDDDPRTGWLSGLEEEEGKRHPTKGGLRIGKSMTERKPGDSFDENLEWDRDGQYFHYLTKWMHALDRVTRVTGDPIYHTWAMELAKTAHARFTYIPRGGGQKRMYWKMSIDLSSPLVSSMGHHDPLDGFITYNELQATAAKDTGRLTGLDLHAEIAILADICKGKNWATDDSLGIGGLLNDAHTVVQLIIKGYFERTDLLENLLDSSQPGLESFARKNSWKVQADYRLAFRELGLSIGLHAVERLRGLIEENPGMFDKKVPLHTKIEKLMRYTPLSEVIESFWLEEANQKSESWTAHQDINMVMLATSLAPDGYLAL
jgi:hypothetical protein